MSCISPIVFRCDTGLRIGLGHFVRCLALAEQLQRRNQPVYFVSDFGGLAWPARQLTRRNVPWVAPDNDTPASLSKQAIARDAAVLVVDSYAPDAAFFAALADRPFIVAAIDDEAKRQLPVDVLINQNFGAEKLDYRTRPDTLRLLGANYALLRRNIIDRRRDAPARKHPPVATNVVLAMGGTDPHGLARTALLALGKTGCPLAVRLIGMEAPTDPPALIAVDLETITGAPDVAEHFLWADLVLAAAGSTAWELACLGAPMVLVTAFENQRIVYDNLLRAGAAVGLGDAAKADADLWAAKLKPLLEDESRRALLGKTAAALIDGEGAAKVAAALFAAVKRKKK